jgi:hypothetical protein
MNSKNKKMNSSVRDIGESLRRICICSTDVVLLENKMKKRFNRKINNE